MTTPLRPELEPLPRRLARLPVDRRGYPVPFFVTWIDGEPEFRATDAGKFRTAIRDRRCWICGEPLGVFKSFGLGPMCTITRTTSEPPCHHDCVTYAARNCPFLVRPHMVRREDAFTNQCTSAGLALARNPGVFAVWTTRTFSLFADPQGRPLITVGEPAQPVEWWREGRAATRDDVMASITSGLPALQSACDLEATDDDRAFARFELGRQIDAAQQWLPA